MLRRTFLLLSGLMLLSTSAAGLAPEPLSLVHPIAQEDTVGQLLSAAQTLILPRVEIAANDSSAPCSLPDVFPKTPNQFRVALQQAMEELPCRLLQSLRKIETMNDPAAPRALAGASILKLRFDLAQKPEVLSVLIHELGHIVDLGGLRGTPESGESAFRDGEMPIFRDDPSVRFYRISWRTTKEKYPAATPEDFVSGYAASDPFEDFAESLLLYRSHGNIFWEMAAENDALLRKYEFLRDEVFDGKEFFEGDIEFAMSPRPWDITKLPIKD